MEIEIEKEILEAIGLQLRAYFAIEYKLTSQLQCLLHKLDDDDLAENARTKMGVTPGKCTSCR